jgi:hypothetical protein
MKSNPHVFRQNLVDGNGGEMRVKANRGASGSVRVFVVQYENGERTGNSNTQLYAQEDEAVSACDRVVAGLQELGWKLKSERMRCAAFSLDSLPEPKKVA